MAITAEVPVRGQSEGCTISLVIAFSVKLWALNAKGLTYRAQIFSMNMSFPRHAGLRHRITTDSMPPARGQSEGCTTYREATTASSP